MSKRDAEQFHSEPPRAGDLGALARGPIGPTRATPGASDYELRMAYGPECVLCHRPIIVTTRAGLPPEGQLLRRLLSFCPPLWASILECMWCLYIRDRDGTVTAATPGSSAGALGAPRSSARLGWRLARRSASTM